MSTCRKRHNLDMRFKFSKVLEKRVMFQAENVKFCELCDRSFVKLKFLVNLLRVVYVKCRKKYFSKFLVHVFCVWQCIRILFSGSNLIVSI